MSCDPLDFFFFEIVDEIHFMTILNCHLNVSHANENNGLIRMRKKREYHRGHLRVQIAIDGKVLDSHDSNDSARFDWI